MERIRILHCIETIGSGGVEQCRLTLAQRLPPARYEQRIVCTQALGGLPQRFAQAGCAVREVGVLQGIFDPAPYRRALAEVRAFRPHLVHGGVYEGVALAAVAGRLGRVPVVLGEETSDPADRRWKGHLLYRLLAGLTHHMVAVSPAVERYLTRQIRLPARKVSLVHNGVAEPAPAAPAQVAALRERLGLQPGDVVVGTVCRLFDHHKRVSDLIRAVALLRESCPGVKLLVVGSGPDEAALRALAAAQGLGERVLFAGYQGDTRPWYELMHVFALASAWEAFGLVLVEAMFARLPVVATRVGGIPGVVAQGVTGLLVEPSQPEALAQALARLVGDPVLCRSMGEQGLRRARAHFGAARYVDEVDRLYTRLLAGTCAAAAHSTS